MQNMVKDNVLITHRKNLDKLGMLLSIICGIHCILTPFALVFGPWLESYLEHEKFHFLIVLIAAPLVVISLYKSHFVHRTTRPLRFGMIGLFMLIAGLITHELDGVIMFAHMLERVFSVLGGVLLFYAHLLNFKCCRCSSLEAHHSH